MRFGWPFIVVLAVLSVVMLFGKGNLIFIGMKQATKKQYNVKLYSRIYGAGCGLVAIILAVVIYNARPHELRWLLTPGISLVLLVTILAANKFGKNK